MELWTTRGGLWWSGTLCIGESLWWRILKWVLLVCWTSGKMKERGLPSGSFVGLSKNWGNSSDLRWLLRYRSLFLIYACCFGTWVFSLFVWNAFNCLVCFVHFFSLWICSCAVHSYVWFKNQISVSIWYFALWVVVIFVWNALNCLDFLCGLSTLVSCSIISCLVENQISVYVNFLVFGCLVLLLDIAIIGYFTWIVYSWFSIFFIVLLTLDG